MRYQLKTCTTSSDVFFEVFDTADKITVYASESKQKAEQYLKKFNKEGVRSNRYGEIK